MMHSEHDEPGQAHSQDTDRDRSSFAAEEDERVGDHVSDIVTERSENREGKNACDSDRAKTDQQ